MTNSFTSEETPSQNRPGTHAPDQLSRRRFLRATGLAAGTFVLAEAADKGLSPKPHPVSMGDLPKGSSPAALSLAHFPDRLHAFVWRNWQLVPLDRMAKVVGASPADLLEIGRSMALSAAPPIPPGQERRTYVTVIRRNWHLLPYEQLLQLLGWTPERMEFTLREDDFLFVKLGGLKPHCEPLRYERPSESARVRARQIGDWKREATRDLSPENLQPLFGFLPRLTEEPKTGGKKPSPGRFAPRYCYSYFALYGDPLLEKEAPPYPEGYLAQLAATGVDGVWLQAVLQKLAPFPWDAHVSERHAERLQALRELVERAGRHGIGVYLYLNEPRSMPVSFFEPRPELKGVAEGAHAALCTSHPDVQQWLVEAVAHVNRAVPGLGGWFTITASENLSNCWSHNQGRGCSRCAARGAAEVIAEVNTLFHRGIQLAGSRARLMAWDWGWADDWAQPIIQRLPADSTLISVSEWGIPIRRGGVPNRIGEYSISTIGPGERARRHWGWARERGLRTIAKIQAGNTWELSAVPYIPALENVAQHAANLLAANVDGLMLGWTLGGYPSPNLEVIAEIAQSPRPEAASQPTPSLEPASLVSGALERVAVRRFGPSLAPAVVRAWREFSAAFREFPFDGGLVYNAPLQTGPSNLLWGESTGYHATMVGIPYDDLDAWRGPYPADVFIGQFEKVADGFEQALAALRKQSQALRQSLEPQQAQNAADELRVAEAAALHFRSNANQARFVQARRQLAESDAAGKRVAAAELERVLRAEIDLARRLYDLQLRDSRIGFEATNHYYYVPLDLLEKVFNCRDLLERWLPERLRREGTTAVESAVPGRQTTGSPHH